MEGWKKTVVNIDENAALIVPRYNGSHTTPDFSTCMR